MAGIIINNFDNEQLFADYLRDRSAGQDKARFGVIPNIEALLAWDAAFTATWAPDGTRYDAEIWAYHTRRMEPLAPHYDAALNALRTFLALATVVEQAVPGTFGIELHAVEPSTAAPNVG